MELKEAIKVAFRAEGFDISKDACEMVNKLDKPMDRVNDLIRLAKERKIIIGSSDISKYLVRGELVNNIFMD